VAGGIISITTFILGRWRSGCVSTGWKRLLKFLGVQIDEEAGSDPTFSPKGFLAKGLQFVRLSGRRDTTPIECFLESLLRVLIWQ